MPRHIIHGEEKRFTVEWAWTGPQDAFYRLKDGDKILLSVNEDNREIGSKELIALCDLLNGLAEKVV